MTVASLLRKHGYRTAMIGRVLHALDETKLAGNTLVIFTSDNGPVWYPENLNASDMPIALATENPLRLCDRRRTRT